MKSAAIHRYLEGGDRRSIGRSDDLVRLLERELHLLPGVIREMWSDDPVVAMRAADAAEKLTRKQPQALQRFKKELLGLAEETSQQELRWHLAPMLARLTLSPAERRRAAGILMGYLQDKSSIVKTFAIQGLFDMSVNHSALRPQVEEILKEALTNGTAAMRARARKLVKEIQRGWQ